MTVRVYVNGLTGWLAAFKSALDPQLAALGLTAAQFPVLEHDPATVAERTVVLYFSDGHHVGSAAEVAELAAHVTAGRVVIPVLDRVDNALAKLPPVLHALNAYPVGAGPTQRWGALVDEIFARAWLARRERKIFLSYKRSDSSAVAHELRDRLSARGYEVFLDECTIAPGEAVQRSLMAWLNDADLVLLLASPQFAASTWVRDEIEFANLASIGLLAVCWPATAALPAWVPLLMSDQQHLLAVGPTGEPVVDFDKIIGLVETQRVRAINRRLCALLPFVRDNIDTARFAVTDHDRLGDLKVMEHATGKVHHVRVVPFRPTIDAVHELSAQLARLPPVEAPEQAFLYFPANDHADRRLRAVAWALEPSRTGIPSSFALVGHDGSNLGIPAFRPVGP